MKRWNSCKYCDGSGQRVGETYSGVPGYERCFYRNGILVWCELSQQYLQPGNLVGVVSARYNETVTALMLAGF